MHTSKCANDMENVNVSWIELIKEIKRLECKSIVTVTEKERVKKNNNRLKD